jgi:hypothetical protein
MYPFLNFTFNADTLREHLREPWMQAYSYEYIDNNIIAGVEKNLPEVADIIR